MQPTGQIQPAACFDMVCKLTVLFHLYGIVKKERERRGKGGKEEREMKGREGKKEKEKQIYQ